jgi:hypothetical protein
LSLKLAVALLRAVTVSNVRSVDQSMLNSQQVRSVDQREFNSHGADAVLRSVDLASASFVVDWGDATRLSCEILLSWRFEPREARVLVDRWRREQVWFDNLASAWYT